jgi:hypothetical protein
MKRCISILFVLLATRLCAQALLFPDTFDQQMAIDTTTVPNVWQYSWTGKAGRNYLIQTSTDLVNWTFLQNFNPQGSGTTLGVNCIVDGSPGFFIRAIEFDPTGPVTAAEDADGNGIPDVWEMYNFGHAGNDPTADISGSGLTTLQKFRYGANPLSYSTDQSGMADGWEVKYFGHVRVDPNAVLSGNSITNLQAFQNGLDPTDYYVGAAPHFASLINNTGLAVTFGSYNGTVNTPTVVHSGTDTTPNLVAITVTKSDGTLLVNAPVTFSTQPDSMGNQALVSPSPGGAGATSVTVITDASGIARIYLVQGNSGTLVAAPKGSAVAPGATADNAHGVIDFGAG